VAQGEGSVLDSADVRRKLSAAPNLRALTPRCERDPLLTTHVNRRPSQIVHEGPSVDHCVLPVLIGGTAAEFLPRIVVSEHSV
jgi:hypothetical protein